jgi:Zn-dependent protease
MRGSVRIARVAGIPIRVHWSFSLLVMLVLFSERGASRPEVLSSLVWIVALFACVTVHELSHCFVARRRGLEVQDIILLPIGGVSEISGMPGAPAIERDVAVAGPLASLGLAVLFGLLTVATGGHLLPPVLFTGSWFARLAWLNLVLAAFNLLPALPMDGGRVLRAVLAGRRDDLAATRIATTVAQVVAAVMIGVGVLDDFWLAIIGVFVLLGASSERRAAGLRAAVRGLQVGNLMLADPVAVPEHVTVQDLASWLAMFPGRAIPVTDGHGCVGVVASEDLTGASPWAAVSSACDRTSPILDASDLAYPAAFDAFSGSNREQLAVTYGGRPVGVLYRATLEAVISPPPRADARSGAGYTAA